MTKVVIDEVVSRITVTDAQSLLTPEVLAQLVQAVKQALDDERQRDAQREADRAIRRSAFALD